MLASSTSFTWLLIILAVVMLALLERYPVLALRALHMVAGRFVQLQNQYRELATERVVLLRDDTTHAASLPPTTAILPNGIPSHDTFGRVFAALDPEQFRAGFLAWIALIQQQTHAWGARNGLVLGQRVTDATSNEITAIPTLLGLLNIQGCTVTIDAMGCQKAIAEQIIKQGKEVCASSGSGRVGRTTTYAWSWGCA